MKDTYTVMYEATPIAGEPGYSYRILNRGREVASGWSRGRKHHAERMARAELVAIERGKAA